MLHHLREHELAQVHPYLPRAVRPQDGPVPRRRRGSNRQLDEGSLSKRFSTTYHDRSAQRWDTTDIVSNLRKRIIVLLCRFHRTVPGLRRHELELEGFALVDGVCFVARLDKLRSTTQ